MAPFGRKRRPVAGSTVLVTGAARGIGEGVAERLHAAGANVALVGLEPGRLAELADRLGPERTLWHEADASDYDAMEGAAAATVERFGRIDAAVANAGVHWTGAFATAPIEQLERELEINLLGVLRTGRAVVPHLIESRGYLLNVASLAAAAHAPLLSAYSASKAGVEALSNSVRQELAPAGVGVGVAYFSFIDTDMVRDGFEHPGNQAMMGILPKMFTQPAPLADAVAAITDGIERRKTRVWAPRYVGPALLSRGWLQPLSELRTTRSRRLAEAVSLSEAGEPPDLSGARRKEAAAHERP
jgi:NAD(P)-dependent dehydrogenase (short-subunit alcohol dehydrogenase family)